ncbi:MAG: hypothetical protein IPL61_25005 [Myxococcales bacterium]|nr:hypothetical protein [Myxococcales bacterium]
MKLGEMLVRDGRLTEAQIDQAVAAQQRSGGRFGTVLFEMGFIDLDALTVYLGLELGIPIATGAMLERAKRAAVKLLTPEQAFRYKCVPLIMQHRQLIAAIDEPHDLDTLDALAHLTGYRIIPRVAAEVRIYYYIERFYGIERPARFLRLGDSPRGDLPPSSSLPAPPLPGLPPQSARPVVAPRPAQPLRFGRAPTPLPVDLAEDLTLEASDMLEEITADSTAVAETAPVAAVRAAGQPVPEGSITQRTWVPLPAAPAIEVITGATDRGAIADAVLGFATTLFDLAVLFIVRDNFAFGWKAVGDGVDLGRIECALVPLEATSIFQQAVSSADGVYHGQPTPGAVLSYWYKVLRVTAPSHATVAAVSIRKRPVNLLYGHRVGRPPLAADELADLAAVTAAAASGYARLIAGAKRRG